MGKKRRRSRIQDEIYETALGLYRAGVIDWEKMQHFATLCQRELLSPEDVERELELLEDLELSAICDERLRTGGEPIIVKIEDL
jgi:hypothetical protein